MLARDGTILAKLLAELTPHQFMQLFSVSNKSSQQFDDWRVESLRKTNDERGRRGLPPVFPSWL